LRRAFALKRTIPEAVFASSEIYHHIIEKADNPLYFAILNQCLCLICVPVFISC
jgi:hypothetical protein